MFSFVNRGSLGGTAFLDGLAQRADALRLGIVRRAARGGHVAGGRRDGSLPSDSDRCHAPGCENVAAAAGEVSYAEAMKTSAGGRGKAASAGTVPKVSRVDMSHQTADEEASIQKYADNYVRLRLDYMGEARE